MRQILQTLLLSLAVCATVCSQGQSLTSSDLKTTSLVTLSDRDIAGAESSYVSKEKSLSEDELENLLGLVRPGIAVTYPHPETNRVKIVKEISEGETYDFKVVNQMGQVLITRIFEGTTEESKEFEFNFSELRDGWYFLRVSTGSGDFESHRILMARE